MTHDTRPPRPRSVTHALWLLYASVVLGATWFAAVKHAQAGSSRVAQQAGQ